MSIKTKAEAQSSIKVRIHKSGKKSYQIYDVYLGTNYITKKQERLYARSKAEILEAIDEFYRNRQESGDFATALTAEQVFDARMAYKALADAGLTITLMECAKAEVERCKAVSVADKVLGDAYAEFYAEKEKTASKAELQKTFFTTGRFVNLFGASTMLTDITPQKVVSYLKTYYDDRAPKTYNSNLRYMSTFFNWCANKVRRYMAENPAAELKPKPEAWKRPKFMTPEQTKALFDLISSPEVVAERPEFLALAVTQFFAGVRDAEAARIAQDPDAATINIDDSTVRVDAGKGATLGKAGRTSHLEPNAVAWMKSFDYASALNRIIPDKTKRDLYRFARKHNVEVFQNCARHTFITMHVAKHHNPEMTQSFVGTSGKMRARNYDGLATQKQGNDYFSIFPSASHSTSSSCR